MMPSPITDLLTPSIAVLAVSMDAKPLNPEIGWLSNSLFFGAFAALVVVVIARIATKKMTFIPRGIQNLFEALIEGLYSTFESIVGRHMIARCFPLLGTLFIFILLANWFSLLPGVGTIGWGSDIGPMWSLSYIERPLLRPATADLNMTLALALIFMVFWLFWTLQELGVGGFLGHMFGPKGGMKGGLALALMPIFLFVGLIEVVSIGFRPVSLSLRLFGNIFAGENLLHQMLVIGANLPTPLQYISSMLMPLPFYFLELLVGLLQAFVFTLLCAVYIQLSTSHDEDDHGGSHEGHDPHALPETEGSAGAH